MEQSRRERTDKECVADLQKGDRCFIHGDFVSVTDTIYSNAGTKRKPIIAYVSAKSLSNSNDKGMWYLDPKNKIECKLYLPGSLCSDGLSRAGYVISPPKTKKK
jgi:hypothetical protein